MSEDNRKVVYILWETGGDCDSIKGVFSAKEIASNVNKNLLGSTGDVTEYTIDDPEIVDKVLIKVHYVEMPCRAFKNGMPAKSSVYHTVYEIEGDPGQQFTRVTFRNNVTVRAESTISKQAAIEAAFNAVREKDEKQG